MPPIPILYIKYRNAVKELKKSNYVMVRLPYYNIVHCTGLRTGMLLIVGEANNTELSPIMHKIE